MDLAKLPAQKKSIGAYLAPSPKRPLSYGFKDAPVKMPVKDLLHSSVDAMIPVLESQGVLFNNNEDIDASFDQVLCLMNYKVPLNFTKIHLTNPVRENKHVDLRRIQSLFELFKERRTTLELAFWKEKHSLKTTIQAARSITQAAHDFSSACGNAERVFNFSAGSYYKSLTQALKYLNEEMKKATSPYDTH